MSQSFLLYRRKLAISPTNFQTRFYSVVQPFSGGLPTLMPTISAAFWNSAGEGRFLQKKQNNFCCFQKVFNFPAANFPLAAGFFRFLQLLAKWELPALSFRSPLCECVAGSQIGYLLCEDCKFLIHVWRCHTIRITRKVSPPCVRRAKRCSGPFL